MGPFTKKKGFPPFQDVSALRANIFLIYWGRFLTCVTDNPGWWKRGWGFTNQIFLGYTSFQAMGAPGGNRIAILVFSSLIIGRGGGKGKREGPFTAIFKGFIPFKP